ncbi:hypothetical protein DVH24_003287 [Malus domestica]|uniref:Ribosomal protein/NADH dehydrogenase domain-containing protein n=1 Tax=Malus domestica TaxID=3750 RepID=A0A498II51_MALDO|nr:hypothetical protein DVH24_003287 [Malus domestica]
MAWRGKLSQNLKELRVLLCQSSPSSASTRAFVEKNYKDLKSANPKLPILIRECRGIQPQLWARYDMGVERGVRLEGLTEPQISKALEELQDANKANVVSCKINCTTIYIAISLATIFTTVTLAIITLPHSIHWSSQPLPPPIPTTAIGTTIIATNANHYCCHNPQPPPLEPLSPPQRPPC